MEIQPVQPEGLTQPKYPKKKQWGELSLTVLLLAAIGLVLLIFYGRRVVDKLNTMVQGIMPLLPYEVQSGHQVNEAERQKFSK